MRTQIPEKVQAIIADIEEKGPAPLARLTVLKKWFAMKPGRLAAFGLWIARRAAARKGKTAGTAGKLLDDTRTFLGSSATRDSFLKPIDRNVALELHQKARMFQNKFQNQQWGPVRIIECRALLLVEEGLSLYLQPNSLPAAGYKLAADWAQNYDAHTGNGLTGASVGKLEELVRFMFALEALEEDPAFQRPE